MVAGRRVPWLFFALVLSCGLRRNVGEERGGSDAGASQLAVGETSSDAALADVGYRYDPHCIKVPLRKDGEFPHVERDGSLYRLCDTQIEMVSLAPIEVPTCESCGISASCNATWEAMLCAARIRVRIDADWAKLVDHGFAATDVIDVEYPELFGRSAQKTTGGVRHRDVDLIFRHGHGWRAHIEYSAPTTCADQIDEMIASAHVPTTFPDDQTLPLRHDD
jgi:hypothetical protein